jgi:hypothetical protein
VKLNGMLAERQILFFTLYTVRNYFPRAQTGQDFHSRSLAIM